MGVDLKKSGVIDMSRILKDIQHKEKEWRKVIVCDIDHKVGV